MSILDHSVPETALDPPDGRRIAEAIQQRHPRWLVWHSRRGDFVALARETTVPFDQRLIRAPHPAHLEWSMEERERIRPMDVPAAGATRGGATVATSGKATLAVLPSPAFATARHERPDPPSTAGHFTLPPAS